ncbi:MAG: type I toxin-antitoxin system SymE family toxin [Candidatus Thiodiazotropha sp. (ex Epidulcina cf. delphinae)]|nr:type I toxin-antitoxin system SymE family toxin [Candidatus Thiodiazotropha sp. (ex Epidulcina cf. delphinae)]
MSIYVLFIFWLAEAGFGIQTPVKVRVMPGCLVLTLVED